MHFHFYSYAVVLTFLSIFGARGFCYRILLVPFPSGSHLISQCVIGRELLRRGHQVHMVLHWSTKAPSNSSEYGADERGFVLHRYGKSENGFNIEKEAVKMTMDIMTKNLGWEYMFEMIINFNGNHTRDMYYKNEQFIEQLENFKFDVAVVDSSFFVRFLNFLPHRLKIPTVTYTDDLESWLVRLPWLPSFASPMMSSTDSHSTFYSRLTNTLVTVGMQLFPGIPEADEKALKEFKATYDFKSSKEIISGSLLFLATSHPVLEVVRPLSANVIQIGGLTTEPWLTTQSPLPQNYLDFFESQLNNNIASLGTVVVSFGSIVPKYPERLTSVLIESFKKLPEYRFVWRFTNHLNFAIPPNVMIVDWLPQKELLSHPSVKLFITHAGNNGQFEAVYHGVPMLAFPLFGDQPKNARRIVERGYGEEIHFSTASVQQCIEKIQKIINDPSFKNNIKKASEIFRSQTETPSQRAAYWIEHVIKYGADHLRPAGNDLYIWQYLCLDVLLFLQLFVLFVVIIVVVTIRAVCRKLRNVISGNNLHNKIKKKSS